MRFIITTESGEGKKDFAITPYLYIVSINDGDTKIYGLGIFWFYYGIALSIGINLPIQFPSYKHFK